MKSDFLLSKKKAVSQYMVLDIQVKNASFGNPQCHKNVEFITLKEKEGCYMSAPKNTTMMKFLENLAYIFAFSQLALVMLALAIGLFLEFKANTI